ncbi:MAG: hemerythrin domain-containing protein [Burkholderiaceae bacterium]
MATRNNSKARTEIIEQLKEDHQSAKKGFRDAEKLDAEEDGDELQAIVQKVCGELEVHTRLEEELFYPAAREAMKEDDLIDEAEVEHGSAKALIAQLREMTPEEEKFQATFKVLGEYVKHHIKEEESEMFPAMQGRSGVDWEQIQQQMQTMREQLMSEMGIGDEQEEEDEEEVTAAPARSTRSSSKRSTPSRRSQAESRPQAADRDEESNE